MSIFNRLKTSLTGKEKAAPAPTPSATDPKPGVGRFMGKDDNQAMRRRDGQMQGVKAPEEGLKIPGEVWVYISPQTQQQVLVEGLGVAEGEPLNTAQLKDLKRWGICEEVSYHAGYDQYWKMPSQTAIMRMPTVYGVEVLPISRIKLSTQLVKPGEPRGFWMRIRLREPSEMPDLLIPTEGSTST